MPSIDSADTRSGRVLRKPPVIDGHVRLTSLLSVSPVGADHDALQQLLRPDRWTVYKARTLGAALVILTTKQFPVVVCESDLGQGSWREMLAQMVRVENSPSLVVTSRLADERMWVDALTLGAYDVLAKPFDARELKRVIGLAWRDWRDRQETPTKRALVKPVMAAAAL